MMMTLSLQILFWVSFGTIFLTYFAYPVTLLLLAPLRKSHAIDDATPTVTLIVSAYNEAAVIREKIENSLALDYPRESLEIMVISDESDDGTDEIVEEYADQGVVLYRQVPRRGKSFGLTQFLGRATGELVVFSDANSIYEPSAVRKLVRHFAEERVGFVVGHQRYIEEDSAASVSESLYWRYETWLKIQESKIGSVVCGDGAIYAIRTHLFEPLREDDINDFTIPLKIVCRGYRGLFDTEAVCYERTAADFGGEFRRKARIVNRSFRAVLRNPGVLNPFRVGLFSYQLVVHKLIRWFVPLFMVTMFIANVALAVQGSTFYSVILGLHIGFYLLALLRLVPALRDVKPIYIANYFCVVNAAAGLGLLNVMFGKSVSTWNPEREETQPSVVTSAK
ncbi:glycosyltransferase family 2 protein [Symmachiella dynata]|uniref:glycosyltransferase family 2 protein n=1 Tax=Symmachiella dynata TaxID=2527995 RepID=UPI0030ECC8D0